ncbi:MAG: putative ABC transporter permease subunit [Bacillota bacterium]
MSGFLTILKMQLRSRYGLSVIKSNYRNDKKAFRKQIGLFILALYGIVALLGTYSFLVYKITELFMSVNQGGQVLIYAFLAILIMILFFGLVVVLGTLFFAKDSEFLSTLPIHQRTVFLSKLAMVYLSELAVSFLLLAPVVIIYGSMAAMGFEYYIKAFVIWLFVPAIPLLIASLLASVFMGFIGKTRHRSLLAIIGGLGGLVLLVAVQMAINIMIQTTDRETLIQMLAQPNGMINLMGSSFPPSAWAVNALLLGGFEGIKYLLGFAGLSLVLFAVVIFIANFIYYRGALSQLETLKKLKIVAKSDYAKRQKPPVFAIFIREWKTILRSPAYAINSLTGIVMGFIVMLLPLISTAAIGDKELSSLFQMLRSSNQDIVCLVLAGFMTLFGSINPAASTALSREGKGVWLSNTFPVPFATQVQAKFLFGYSIAAATAFSTGLGAIIGVGLNILTVVFAFLISLVVLAATTAISLEIDLIRPKFVWNNEMEAIKQNMNSLWAMLLSLVLLALFGGFIYVMTGVIANTVYITLITLALAAAVFFIGYTMLMNTAKKAYYEV